MLEKLVLNLVSFKVLILNVQFCRPTVKIHKASVTQYASNEIEKNMINASIFIKSTFLELTSKYDLHANKQKLPRRC